MPKLYPEEVKKFIEQNVKGLTTKELVNLVNTKFNTDFTISRMKSYKANHKLKSGILGGLPAGRPTALYPEEVKKFIEQNHRGIGPVEMSGRLNSTFGTNYTKNQMLSYYKNHKLNSGVNTKFQKGHIPLNKGKKGMGGWKPTQFKKGNLPSNYKPVGTERVNVEGYVEIKVADPNKWKGKHTATWEEKNGPVPKGYAVIFGDGDKRNFNLDNLILVSRKQLITLNTKKLIQNDADLTRSALLVVDVYHKISEIKNKTSKPGRGDKHG